MPTPRAEQFDPLPSDVAARWQKYGRWPDRTYFPKLLGLEIEEVRTDYCRMRLPFRAEHEQPAGVIHGGALASLVDSVLVPAIGSAYDDGTTFVTVNLNINYLGAVKETDAIAEGWVTRRGRSTVFAQAQVTAGDRVVVEASLVYAVRAPT